MTGSWTPWPEMARVLEVLVADPRRWWYGHELGARAGLAAGTLYPIVLWLTDRFLVEERCDDGTDGKPRPCYRLTPPGLAAAAVALAELAAAERAR